MTRIPSLGPRGEGWVAIQLILLLATAVLGALAIPAAAAGWPNGWPLVLQGAVLLVIGGLAALAGLRQLGPSLTALPRPLEDGVLVENGIYRLIRHPIYAGVMCLAVGWSLVTLSLPAMGTALLLVLVLDLKARREEVWLDGHYPAYAAYRSRTRRFIPAVY